MNENHYTPTWVMRSPRSSTSLLLLNVVLCLMLLLVACAPEEENDIPIIAPTISSEGGSILEELESMPNNYNKLSPETKRLIFEMAEDDNPEVSVIIRVDGSLTSAQKKQLEAGGITVRTVTGDVVTLTMPYSALPQLAGLDYVTYIELSGPLYLE